jgi:hypothetical protein
MLILTASTTVVAQGVNSLRLGLLLVIFNTMFELTMCRALDFHSRLESQVYRRMITLYDLEHILAAVYWVRRSYDLSYDLSYSLQPMHEYPSIYKSMTLLSF